LAKEFNGDGKEARSLADMPRSVMKKPSVEFFAAFAPCLGSTKLFKISTENQL